MREEADTVIAVVERSQLSGLLTAIHRAGHGHHARVLDPARGSLAGQLQRAGIAGQDELLSHGKHAVLVLVHAPGRAQTIAALLQRAGAQRVIPVRRSVPAAGSPFVPPAWTERGAPSGEGRPE